MLYQLGAKIQEFRGQDGVYLSIDESGVLLLCRMNRPTSDERRAFNSSQPIQIAMDERDGVLYWCVRFGDLDPMDCTYSPQVASHVPELETPEKGTGYALTVILADGSSGEIVKLRVVGLPHDFSVRLKSIYDSIRGKWIDYPSAIAGIYRCSTEQLEASAKYHCMIAKT